MNIDELIGAARPDPQPTSVVIDRHRTVLLERTQTALPAESRATVGRVLVDSGRSTRSEWPGRRRWVLAMSGALVAVVGAAAVLLSRSDQHVSVTTDRQVTASSPPLGTTTSTLVSADATVRIESVDMPAFVGPIDIRLHPASVDIDLSNGSILRLSMTDAEFCTDVIETDLDLSLQHGCGVAPTGLSVQGSAHLTDRQTGDLLETLVFGAIVFAPDDVTLRLLDGDGLPACPLDPHPVPDIGPMVVWTCDGSGAVDHWDLEATAEGRTVVSRVPIPESTWEGVLPAIGDTIPDADVGDWVQSWSFDVDPARAESLVPVGRDGVVIGYMKFGAPPLPPGSEGDDLSSVIYDGDGVPIGRFVDGSPMLDSDPPTTTTVG